MPRILVTREFAEPLQRLLVAQGCEVVHVPLVELEATHTPAPDSSPDAVVVTSQAVVRFVPELRSHIQGSRVIAVGMATAEALLAHGVVPNDVGRSGGLEALAYLQLKEGERAWYVGAQNPSPKLAAALDEMGIERWPVYQNTRPAGFEELLRGAEFDGIAFTSGSAVRAFVEVRGVPQCPVFALGSSTAEVAEELGVGVTAIAERASFTKLADVVASGF